MNSSALSAGLGRCSWLLDTEALPGLADCSRLATEVRAMPLEELASDNHRDTALGQFALRLREYMCGGSDCVMLRQDMKEKLHGAFAGLAANGPPPTLAMYHKWVGRLATKEYADELVVVACSLELKVQIVCIPWTPSDAQTQWKISTYQPPGWSEPSDATVYLGNNDVHSMWLTSL